MNRKRLCTANHIQGSELGVDIVKDFYGLKSHTRPLPVLLYLCSYISELSSVMLVCNVHSMTTKNIRD